MTKVAIIGPIHPYRGGIAQYTAFLCRALDELKHNSHLAPSEQLLISYSRQYPAFLFPGATDREPLDHEQTAETNAPDLVTIQSPELVEGDARFRQAQPTWRREQLQGVEPHFWIDSLNPLTWFYTLYRLQCYKPDVLVIQWWTSFWAGFYCLVGLWVWLYNFFAIRLRATKPISLAIICHNVLPHETRWWDVIVAKWAIRWGHRYIVQSESERLRLHSFLPDVQSAVVPHPQYDTLADLRESQEAARAKLDIDRDTYILLFFGIVRPYKGLKDLLHALPELGQLCPIRAFSLIIAGEFWDEKQAYLEIIQALDLSDRVMIDDCYVPKERVALYFSAADLLVAPYLYETGSAVLGMANGFGLKTVSSADIADIGDSLQHSRPASRPRAIAEAICQAIETESRSAEWMDIKQSWRPTVQAIMGNKKYAI